MKIYYERDLKYHYTTYKGLVKRVKRSGFQFIGRKDTVIIYECNYCTKRTNSEKTIQKHIIEKHRDWLKHKGHIHYKQDVVDKK